MDELKDIVDEVIPLEEVFFPKDKSKCGHVALDDTFIPVKDGDRLIGCIMKCANCGHLEEYKCTCSVGAIEIQIRASSITCMPVTYRKIKSSLKA